MSPNEFLAVTYHLGYRFARQRLDTGEDRDAVRCALGRALDHLRALGAYSAPLEAMKRLGAEDALAGKPPDRRYAAPGEPRQARNPPLARRGWPWSDPSAAVPIAPGPRAEKAEILSGKTMTRPGTLPGQTQHSFYEGQSSEPETVNLGR
jgi:hypothetical protein